MDSKEPYFTAALRGLRCYCTPLVHIGYNIISNDVLFNLHNNSRKKIKRQ